MKFYMIFASLWLLVARWPMGESHLLQKINWIQTDHAMAAIDWFDLAFHGLLPPAVLIYVLVTFLKERKRNETSEIEIN